MQTTTSPASQAQVALIDQLYAERDLDLTPWANYAHDTHKASQLIDALRDAPRRTPAPGLYVLDGKIIKVQQSRSDTYRYTLELVPSGSRKRGKWAYRPNLIDKLAGATPATADDMAAYGARTGTCGICGALLTDPASIARGIGPVCAKRI